MNFDKRLIFRAYKPKYQNLSFKIIHTKIPEKGSCKNYFLIQV